MQAIPLMLNPKNTNYLNVATADLQQSAHGRVEVEITWVLDPRALDGGREITNPLMQMPLPSGLSVKVTSMWERQGNSVNRDGPTLEVASGELDPNIHNEILRKLEAFKIFSFDAQAMTDPVTMRAGIELAPNGRNLAGVLENLRDVDEDRFKALNEELRRWLPEFDRMAFETPSDGQKAFLLQMRQGKHKIKAADLSHGTLFALAFLTLAYLPQPPSIICFEEPERGIHPRLFREIRDALYRLCYPEDYGDRRDPVQVIATTHSPYLLDLYKDHPEEIVIAHKDEQGVHFERLSDKPNIDEFLRDAPLGEVWYSGILGGVPANT